MSIPLEVMFLRYKIRALAGHVFSIFRIQTSKVIMVHVRGSNTRVGVGGSQIICYLSCELFPVEEPATLII